VTVEIVPQIYLALLGLVVGSYLNVVAYRLPRRMSTVLPRSRCTRCRSPIRPWDNVPVVSYLLLRGRCRHCGASISWRYPLVEALTSLSFVASFHAFRTSATGILIACVFSAAMIVLAMIDLEHYLLPDAITIPGIVLGLAVLPWLNWVERPRDLFVGAAVGAGLLYVVSLVWYLWKKVHGMGMGDVKMLAMIGAVLGWQGVVFTLFLASLMGSLVGGGLILAGRLGWKSRLPFGVFLALGALVTLFFRLELTRFYGEVGYAIQGLFV